MKKIIITTPDLNKSGGVSAFVRSLKGFWDLEEVYFIRGGKPNNKMLKILLTLLDFVKFFILSIFNKKSYLFINTSLNKDAFSRDYFFLLTLKIIGIKPNIFIHGFDLDFFHSLPNSKFKIFNFAQNIFVLSKQGKSLLEKKINHNSIFVETTVADYDFSNHIFKDINFESEQLSFLFLARLEKAKGLWQTLFAIKQLNEEKTNIKLEIVGYGSEVKEVEKWIKEQNNSNFVYSGKLLNMDKIQAFERNQIYILPSDTEGLPITIVEAMFAGLPIICTKVGAIPEFFIDGKMGLLLEDNSVLEIKEKIKNINKNRTLLKEMSIFNKQFAFNTFQPTIVAKRIKNIITNGTSTNN